MMDFRIHTPILREAKKYYLETFVTILCHHPNFTKISPQKGLNIPVAYYHLVNLF